jgi:hypothetical protein
MYDGIIMAGRKSIENSIVIQARMLAFAAAYCLYTARVGIQGGARKKAAEAIGINDKMAKWYLNHPIVKNEIVHITQQALKKYDKTADDVLSEIATTAFGKPEGKLDYNSKLSALRMLAQHHNVIGELNSDGSQRPNVVILLPDNKSGPDPTKEIPYKK